MKKYLVSLIGGLLAVFFFASASFATAAVTRPAPLKNREKAPAFRLATVNGGSKALVSYKGKRVILMFFTTWCPYCVTKLRDMETKQARLKKEGVVLLPIDVGESQSKVASFRRKKKITFDILLDRSRTVSRKYGVKGVPTFFLVGTEGTVLYDGNSLPRNYLEIFARDERK